MDIGVRHAPPNLPVSPVGHAGSDAGAGVFISSPIPDGPELVRLLEESRSSLKI
jgi:hypothetical protein